MMTSMTGMFSSALTASPIALATWVPPIFLKLTQENQKREISQIPPPADKQKVLLLPQAQLLRPTNTMRAAIGGDNFLTKERSHKYTQQTNRKSYSPPQAQQLWPTDTMREAAIGGDDFPFDASYFPLSDLPLTLCMSHEQAILI